MPKYTWNDGSPTALESYWRSREPSTNPKLTIEHSILDRIIKLSPALPIAYFNVIET